MCLVLQDSYRELLNKVLDIFQPGKFLLTVFANKASVACNVHKEIQTYDVLKDYRQADHQFCQFKDYNLTYAHFTRPEPPAAPPH